MSKLVRASRYRKMFLSPRVPDVPADPDKRHARNNLDVLRLIFASLVLLSHAPELVDGNRSRELLSILTRNTQSFGELAVNRFFALSGYLIMASWCRHPRLRIYFSHRILRIYPAFIVAFCISVLVVGPLATSNESAYFDQFGLKQFLFSLVTVRDPWFARSFEGLHYKEVNGAMWTISYEFVCYIAVAAVGCCTRRHLKVIWIALTALVMLVACFHPELRQVSPVGHFGAADFIRMTSPFFFGGTLYLIRFEGFNRLEQAVS